jgi:hypothetical protein
MRAVARAKWVITSSLASDVCADYPVQRAARKSAARTTRAKKQRQRGKPLCRDGTPLNKRGVKEGVP